MYTKELSDLFMTGDNNKTTAILYGFALAFINNSENAKEFILTDDTTPDTKINGSFFVKKFREMLLDINEDYVIPVDYGTDILKSITLFKRNVFRIPKNTPISAIDFDSKNIIPMDKFFSPELLNVITDDKYNVKEKNAYEFFVKYILKG